MKRILIIVTVFFISLNISNAQLLKTVGIKAGISVSELSLTYRESSNSPIIKAESDNAISFNAMVTADVVMKKYWAINASVGVAQKRSAKFYDTGDKEFNLLNYVSLISSIRGQLPISKIVNLYVQTGIRCDFLIHKSGEFYLGFPGDPDINKMSYGLNTGGGVSFRLGKAIVGLEVSRNFNFNRIIDEKGQRPDGIGDEKYFYKLNDKTQFFNLSFVRVITK
jgi:hypothetical protein